MVEEYILDNVFKFRNYKVQDVQLDNGLRMRKMIVNLFNEGKGPVAVLNIVNREAIRSNIMMMMSPIEFRHIKKRLVKFGVLEEKNGRTESKISKIYT